MFVCRFNNITIDETNFDRVEVYGSDRGVAELVLLKYMKPVVLSSTSGSISDGLPSLVLDDDGAGAGVHGYSIEGDPSLLHLEGSTLSNQSRPSSQAFTQSTTAAATTAVSPNVAVAASGSRSTSLKQLQGINATDSKSIHTARSLPMSGAGSGSGSGVSKHVLVRSPSSDIHDLDATDQRRVISGGGLESLSEDRLTNSMISGELSRGGGVSFRGSVPPSSAISRPSTTRPSTMNNNNYNNDLTSPSIVTTTKEPTHCSNDFMEVGRLVLTRDKVKEFQLPLPPAQAQAKDVDHFFSDMDNGPSDEELRVQWSEWFSTLQYLLKVRYLHCDMT